MTLVRICSDLHTEFWVTNQCLKKTIRILERKEVLPPDERDKDSILVIAGDLGSTFNLKQQEEILTVLSSRFKSIVLCMGNHEYYGGDWVKSQKTYTELYSKFSNLYTEYTNEPEEGYLFFSGTLWTDFNKENPMSMELARAGMNDYNQITNGDRNLIPRDTLLDHKYTLASLNDFLTKDTDKTKIVVTHHSPLEQSIPPIFKTNKLNPCYYTDLSELILDTKPLIWIHGHTHQAQDYTLGGATRIICNPYGYRGSEKTGYDPLKFINI